MFILFPVTLSVFAAFLFFDMSSILQKSWSVRVACLFFTKFLWRTCRRGSHFVCLHLCRRIRDMTYLMPNAVMSCSLLANLGKMVMSCHSLSDWLLACWGNLGVCHYSGTLIRWCASKDQSILSSPSTVLMNWLGNIS